MIVISIIVAFYNGNSFLKRLLTSIDNVEKYCSDNNKAQLEILIINDSPNIKVKIPKEFGNKNNIKVISNKKNVGIHQTRVNGLKHASGDWLIFLDQDDELLVDGFSKQLELTAEADVIVGNGFYQLNGKNIKIYDNLLEMDYLIQKEKLLRIRNLIPSPGECLIRKKAISKYWQKNFLKANGADDWYLWLLMFWENKKFASNSEVVYIHNDVEGQNLSRDLDKMYVSSCEMHDLLKKSQVFTEKEMNQLQRAIDFKYYQDSKKLSFYKILKYSNVILDNVVYKINVYIKRGKH